MVRVKVLVVYPFGGITAGDLGSKSWPTTLLVVDVLHCGSGPRIGGKHVLHELVPQIYEFHLLYTT